MIKLKDIAAAAGVSPGAASVVLNGTKSVIKVSEETAERIRKTAKEMNYQPNLSARGLRTGRNFLIGMLVPNVTHSIIPEIIQGVEDRLLKSKFGLLLGTYGARAELKKKVDFFLEKSVDGAIVLPEGPAGNAVEYKRLADAVPLVCVAGGGGVGNYPRVYADGEAIGRIATEYLISLGHRQIGYVTRHDSMRLKGCREILKQYGLTEHSLSVIELQTPEVILKNFLALNPRPTGLIFESDMSAAEFLAIAPLHGICIPGDVSVVGTDDCFFGTICSPQLTTIAPCKREQGCEAAEAILKLIHGDVFTRTVLQPSLIARQSCAYIKPVL